MNNDQLTKAILFANDIEGYTDDAMWLIDLDGISTSYPLDTLGDEYTVDWDDDDDIKLKLRIALIDTLEGVAEGIRYDIDEQKAKLADARKPRKPNITTIINDLSEQFITDSINGLYDTTRYLLDDYELSEGEYTATMERIDAYLTETLRSMKEEGK